MEISMPIRGEHALADVAVPADVLAELPKGVAGALKERKTIVLGVVFSDDASNWRPMADDDRYVADARRNSISPAITDEYLRKANQLDRRFDAAGVSACVDNRRS
jgi:hypothetical protein